MSSTAARQYSFLTDFQNAVAIDDRKVDKELDEIIIHLNRKVLATTTTPTGPIDGQTWVDLNLDPPAVKLYDGTAGTFIFTTKSIVQLTNRSGAQSVVGDVVVIDTANATSYDDTTSEGATRGVGVVLETINNASTGSVQIAGGIVNDVKVTGTVNIGDYLVTSTTATRAKAVSAPQAGVFAIALTSNPSGTGVVDAILVSGGVGGAAGTTPALVFSTTNAAGAATTFLRSNDQIAIFDATVPTTVDGVAAAAGSAAFAARRDHQHAFEVEGFGFGFQMAEVSVGISSLNVYVTIDSATFRKIAGVNTLKCTLHVRSSATTGTDSWRLNVSALNGTAGPRASTTTYSWDTAGSVGSHLQLSLDISSLTAGTEYTVNLQTTNDTTVTQTAFAKHIQYWMEP